jgi:hypothetical protein
MEGLPSRKQMLLLINSQHVSVQIGHHHQVILEEYTNGDGIHINYNATIKCMYEMCSVTKLCIPQQSPDDGLSGPKHVVNGKVKTIICVTATPRFSFESTKNRMQQCENPNPHRSLLLKNGFATNVLWYCFHASWLSL